MENWVFQQSTARKGVNIAFSSETMSLCSQLGEEKILHIHNQLLKNPRNLFFLIFDFYAQIFKRKCFFIYFLAIIVITILCT